MRNYSHSLEEFLQNVSHELRTPLGIVHGHVELLASGELGEPLPEHKESINIVARRVKMLRKMVEDLAILGAERDGEESELVDLGFLVRVLLDDFQVSAQQAGLTLTVEITPDLPPVSGRASHLRQVVDNLVANAIKYTPSGGIILRLRAEEKDVILEVTDTGIGIAGDQLGRIFERFYQVDGSASRRYGGTGLGLALVQEIVQAHGGQVCVQSAPGEGSTFQFRLPSASS